MVSWSDCYKICVLVIAFLCDGSDQQWHWWCMIPNMANIIIIFVTVWSQLLVDKCFQVVDLGFPCDDEDPQMAIPYLSWPWCRIPTPKTESSRLSPFGHSARWSSFSRFFQVIDLDIPYNDNDKQVTMLQVAIYWRLPNTENRITISVTVWTQCSVE